MASILNLNGDFLGLPTVVSWEPGRTDVFVRGPTNNVLHKFQPTPDSKWRPSESDNVWETLAGDAFSDIAAVSWGSHRIDLFWIGANNAIQHLFWNGTTWDLESLSGAAIGTIAAVSWGIGKLAVFHRGTDNAVYVNLYHNNKWDGWTKLGGEIVGSPVALSCEENRVDVFHRGGGLDVYHKTFHGTTMTWSGGWECTAVGAILIDDITAVSPAPGTIHLFGIGTNNGVFIQTCSNGKWGAWESLGGNTRSKPSAVAFDGAAVGVAIQGHNNAVNVNVRQSPGSAWTGWVQIGDIYLATQMPVLHPRATFNMVSFVRDPAANLVIVKRSVASTSTT